MLLDLSVHVRCRLIASEARVKRVPRGPIALGAGSQRERVRAPTRDTLVLQSSRALAAYFACLLELSASAAHCMLQRRAVIARVSRAL
eukprot:4060635-Alexandrium_andersonii.AAC.2